MKEIEKEKCFDNLKTQRMQVVKKMGFASNDYIFGLNPCHKCKFFKECFEEVKLLL